MTTLDARARSAAHAINAGIAEFTPAASFDVVVVRQQRWRTIQAGLAGAAAAVLVVLAGMAITPSPAPEVAEVPVTVVEPTIPTPEIVPPIVTPTTEAPEPATTTTTAAARNHDHDHRSCGHNTTAAVDFLAEGQRALRGRCHRVPRLHRTGGHRIRRPIRGDRWQRRQLEHRAGAFAGCQRRTICCYRHCRQPDRGTYHRALRRSGTDHDDEGSEGDRVHRAQRLRRLRREPTLRRLLGHRPAGDPGLCGIRIRQREHHSQRKRRLGVEGLLPGGSGRKGIQREGEGRQGPQVHLHLHAPHLRRTAQASNSVSSVRRLSASDGPRPPGCTWTRAPLAS